MRIKRINEFFDSDELKAEYELPYLRGEMPDIIKNYKEFKQPEDVKFIDSMIFQFPVLSKLHNKVVEKGTTKIHLYFATSTKHVNGDDYYASITFSFYKNQYNVITIFRKLEEHDKSKWDVENNAFDDMKSATSVVANFIKRCEDFNILEPKDNFNLQSN
jgi:hypothetical protein